MDFSAADLVAPSERWGGAEPAGADLSAAEVDPPGLDLLVAEVDHPGLDLSTAAADPPGLLLAGGVTNRWWDVPVAELPGLQEPGQGAELVGAARVEPSGQGDAEPIGLDSSLAEHEVELARAAEVQPPGPGEAEPSGPQQGRGRPGQYVYWITMAHPSQATIARLGIKAPSDLTRDSFRSLVVARHTACGVHLVETVCFLEPHANGLPHLNLLVRCLTQYRWKRVAAKLREQDRVHVDFATNIKTWAEGVAYGRVPSDHKPRERLDPDPVQWVPEGIPTPMEQFLPHRWSQPGFSRKTRLSNLTFFDLCQQHDIRTGGDLWAKAAELDKAGDRGLLAFLLENDADTMLAKVKTLQEAQEKARRAKLTREQLLEECALRGTCTCATLGHCYGLMKGLLVRNNLDGQLQVAVLGALRTGRAKMRNVCLVGGPDAGKSFLFRGLKEIFRTYERPDGGSYQLEELLDKELVLLNDFEYDSTAKSWMAWSYFKNFLEGGSIPVARPKNRGGNVIFDGTAPVLMTAPQEVTLVRYGKEVEAETAQMRRRITYFHLTHAIPADEREEVTRHCGKCTARLFLEGRSVSEPAPADAPAQDCFQVLAATARAFGLAPVSDHSQQPPSIVSALQSSGFSQDAHMAGSTSVVSPSSSSSHREGPPPSKQPRTAEQCIQELKDLKALRDSGALTMEEFTNLKRRLLCGD